MPKVPTYQPRITPRPLQGGVNVSIPRGAFGDASGLIAAGQELGKAGSDMDKIAADMKQRDDKRIAKEAYLAAKNSLRVQMYGTGKNGQPQGLLTLQGDAAKDVVENSRKSLDSVRADAEKGLKNETQRELFKTFFDGDEQSTLDKAYAHQNKQMTDLEIRTTASLIDDATQDMIEAHTPEEMARAKRSLEAHSMELARLQGLPDEARVNLVEKQVSTAHTNRLAALIADEDFGAAREYMRVNGDAILPAQRTGLEAKIKNGEQSRQAFDIGMNVFNGMPNASLQDKIKAARDAAKGDFDVEKSAVNWVKSLHSEMERSKSEYRTNVENSFRAAAMKAATPQGLHDLEVQAQNIVDPEAQKRAISAIRSGGKAPETSSPESLASAEKDIADGMSAVSLEAKYWKSLSDKDMSRLKTRIGKVSGERVNRYMLGLKQGLEQMIPGKSDAAKKKRTAFASQMDQFADEYAAAHDGANPTDKEMDDHKKFLLRERVYDDNWWGDNTTPQYLMGTMKMGDMPEKDAKFLTDYWKGKGLDGEALTRKVEESYRDGKYLDTDEYKAVK